ncbi:MAG TPA: DUF309 domain-containing protein [Dehalococcoidia bacterium]|nr:DUF309 domain-containing protein [Dehalococcoidia bacterium]
MAGDGQTGKERTTRRGHGARPRPAIPKIGRGLPSPRCAEAPPALVLEGFAQFNRGEFFEQHETLEDAWIAETDPIRYLYQGILQVGVGLLHLQRGNLYGAARMMAKGLRLLQPFQPRCLGVDVERFVAESERCLAAVEALTPESLSRFDKALIPRVHLAGA